MQACPYFLPQHLSAQRRRSRLGWLEIVRPRYALAPDSPTDVLGADMRMLPPHVANLPTEQAFAPGVMGTFLGQKVMVTANQLVSSARVGYRKRLPETDFRRLFSLFGAPEPGARIWRSDLEFARQRVAGVNPMHLQRCTRVPTDEAWLGHAHQVMKACETPGDWKKALRVPELFELDYSVLDHPTVLRYLKPDCVWATPKAWFWVDGCGRLRPLLIELRKVDGRTELYSPLDPPGRWLLARSVVQMADAVLHEGFYHLLETHLVGEAIGSCLYQTIHPDHPLYHLLTPHFRDTMAINHEARGDLLALGGPIDVAVGVGVLGTMNATRRMYGDWDWNRREFHTNLRERGVHDESVLPFYPYRDDLEDVSSVILGFVSGMLGVYYQTDADVALDPELRAFTTAVASERMAGIRGFPAEITTKDDLFRHITHLITRLTVHHAAVNNGQFDAYAYVPNAPTSLYALPGDAREQAFWDALPDRSQCFAQLGLVWVLSRPTRATILYAGEEPAFSPAINVRFAEVLTAFRRGLEAVSGRIGQRNAGLDVPYVYCDPYNIARSVDI